MKRIVIILLSVFVYGVGLAQHFPLEVSHIYSSNTITNYQNQDLILVDFWATWCGPCKPATEQLQILQEQFKNDLFVISVTDETPEKVHQYTQNNTHKLMIACDVGGYLVRKFKVYSRPYAVLLNKRGSVIWRGHPSDLKPEKIRAFSRVQQIERRIDLNKIISLVVLNNSPKSPLGFTVQQTDDMTQSFIQNEEMVEYSGSLTKLVALLKQVPDTLVSDIKNKDIFIQLQSPIKLWNMPDSIFSILKKQFNVVVFSRFQRFEVNRVWVKETTKLWDTEQINWGKDNVYNHLIGEDRIQADNISIRQFFAILSNAKRELFLYDGLDSKLYDWDVHFLFSELMISELNQEFGIAIEKKEMKVEVFELR